ncbi:MAG: DNA repair protein RadC [Lachnospiraceae bacterium]|nr:DNA repair protein RadC [Lachnospiraceae bacterium]
MNYNLIRETPVGERPYERCEKYGPEVLTDSELLAVFIRNGTKDRGAGQLANDVLALCGKNRSLGHLLNLSMSELMHIDGIGRVKAIELLCLCELSKRMWRQSRFGKRIHIRYSGEAAAYYMEELRYLDRERVCIMLLDSRQYFIGDIKMSEGTSDMSPVSVREILKKALSMDAAKLIFVHNHPSGDPNPSSQDIKTSKILFTGCSYVGIQLLDSLIIGDGVYFSFLEKGKDFEQL